MSFIPPARRRRARRRWTAVVATLTALVLVLTGSAGPAFADPDGTGTKTLSQALEESARAYSKAQVALKASQKRQVAIEKKLKTVNLDLIRLQVAVGSIAAARYKGTHISLFTSLIDADASEDLLQGAAVAEYLTWRDDAQLRELKTTQDEGRKQREALNAEIHEQEKVFAAMDKAKRKAEKALAAVGGTVSAGFKGNPGQPAQPAPRDADGNFPGQGCTVDDPTTGGCLTPRTYHMYLEAQFAGYQRYVSCFRESSWGEHPQGRACDFAADKYGFGGVAVGDSKTYGTNLAAWAIRNAEVLGVMYVIWFDQIWELSSGWHAYDGDGSPAGNHENHVHISML